MVSALGKSSGQPGPSPSAPPSLSDVLKSLQSSSRGIAEFRTALSDISGKKGVTASCFEHSGNTRAGSLHDNANSGESCGNRMEAGDLPNERPKRGSRIFLLLSFRSPQRPIHPVWNPTLATVQKDQNICFSDSAADAFLLRYSCGVQRKTERKTR